MKNYIHIKDTTFIKVEVYYNKGGMNYFTYRNEPRGYYLSVSPVERQEVGNCVTESFRAFSGVKRLVLEVKRKSDKAMETAVELAKQLQYDMIEQVKQNTLNSITNE